MKELSITNFIEWSRYQRVLSRKMPCTITLVLHGEWIVGDKSRKQRYSLICYGSELDKT